MGDVLDLHRNFRRDVLAEGDLAVTRAQRKWLVTLVLSAAAAISLGAGPEIWHSIASSGTPAAPEYAFASGESGETYSLNHLMFGYHVPAGGSLTVTAMSALVLSGAGSAATWTATLTDGTNTCTVSKLCSSLTGSGTSVYRIAAVNGSGTGCTYAGGALIVGKVTTGCTGDWAGNFVFTGTWN